MFLQFFVWGAWYVALYGFLDSNGMTAAGDGGSFDAAAYTVAPIAAILAPLTLGLIADRFLNTEKSSPSCFSSVPDCSISPPVWRKLARRARSLSSSPIP